MQVSEILTEQFYNLRITRKWLSRKSYSNRGKP